MLSNLETQLGLLSCFVVVLGILGSSKDPRLVWPRIGAANQGVYETNMPPATTLLLLSIIGAACLVPSVIAASAYDYGFDTGPLIRRQVSENGNNPRNRIVAKGARRSNDSKSVPLRREIREFQEDGDQWTLFILGLSLMQFDDQDEAISFYQIAGTFIFFFSFAVPEPWRLLCIGRPSH